jgi:hypothetical protein
MALTDCNTNTVLTDKPENVNYLANNFFQFHIDRIPNFTYFIQSANLPMLSTRSINQPSTLGTFPKIPATNFIFDDLQITFLVDSQMKSWTELYNWMKSIGNLKDTTSQIDHHQKFSDATLLITNSAYKPILKVTYYYIFPNTLGSINFSVTSQTTGSVVCSANFSYSYFEIEEL